MIADTVCITLDKPTKQKIDAYVQSHAIKKSDDATIEKKLDDSIIIDRANKKIMVCDKEVIY